MRRKARSPGMRALQVFLWAGVSFALVQLGGNLWIGVCQPELRSAYLLDVFQQAAECDYRPQILCLGTSRLGMGLNCEVANAELRQGTRDPSVEVFNASIASQDFPTAEFLLRQLQHRGFRPQLVVVEVSPELLAEHNYWLGAHGLPAPPLSDLSLYLGDLGRSVSTWPRLLWQRTCPLYHHRREIWTHYPEVFRPWLGDPVPSLVRRFARFPGDRSAAARSDQAAQEMYLDTRQTLQRPERVREGLAKLRLWLDDYRVGGLAARSLTRLVERCRQQGSTVVLVMPPVASEQRTLYTPAIQTAFRSYLDQLVRATGCQLVNGSAELPDEVFLDNHHVQRPRGALVFSRWLARQVLVPAWRSRQQHGTVASSANPHARPDSTPGERPASRRACSAGCRRHRSGRAACWDRWARAGTPTT
jgi:hypothetical protein